MCLIMTEDGWKQLSDGLVCSNHNQLEGVFRPMSLEEAQAVNAVRTDAWVAAMQYEETRMSLFRGDSFIQALYDGFGKRV